MSYKYKIIQIKLEISQSYSVAIADRVFLVSQLKEINTRYADNNDCAKIS